VLTSYQIWSKSHLESWLDRGTKKQHLVCILWRERWR